MTASIRGLAYTTDGPAEAPPLVLIHPIATSSRIWEPQLPVWARHWRVVRIDLPGHGASLPPTRLASFAEWADDLAAVLDHLGMQQVSMVGLSLGGMVAQAFALNHAERLTSLVLAHTSAHTAAPVREMWTQRTAQVREFGVAAQVDPTLARWFTRSFLERAPLTTRWVAEQICATSIEGYAAAAEAIRDLNHLERLREIRAPTLVVAGADDTAAPPALGAAIVERMQQARLAIIDHAAHLGNVEQPIVFAELIGGFLTEVQDSGVSSRGQA